MNRFPETPRLLQMKRVLARPVRGYAGRQPCDPEANPGDSVLSCASEDALPPACEGLFPHQRISPLTFIHDAGASSEELGIHLRACLLTQACSSYCLVVTWVSHRSDPSTGGVHASPCCQGGSYHPSL